jgi:hypothetical protein
MEALSVPLERRRHLAIAGLALGLSLAACQSAAVSPQPGGGTSEPEPQASHDPSAAVGVPPTIDPDWITRPALTCGDHERLFPPEALQGPGIAQLGPDLAAGVLRSVIADAPPETPLPDSGWHRVVERPDGVTFVAAGDDTRPWWVVTVGILEGRLQPLEFGQCRLTVAAPSGVRFARWWLDPSAPPITPDRTTLAILVREQACASGQPPDEGRLMDPTIIITAESIGIAIAIREQPNADCPGNPAFPLQLTLSEPIGSRGLFDTSEFPPRPVTSADPQ